MNKLCAWRHNMPPPPASLTIISCKYETVKDYNLPLNSLKDKQQQREKISTVLLYQVCADTVKAKQSTAENWCRLCLFCPSNKFTFDLLILKVVSESRVTWVTSVPILVFLCLSVLDLGPMYATDRQTSDAHHYLKESGHRWEKLYNQ